VFFDLPTRRKLPRLAPLALLALGVVLAGGVGLAVLLTRDSPPAPAAPVAATRAEERLVHQLHVRGSVHCAGDIRPGRSTRCQFLYPDGDTRLMLVTLTAAGGLEIDVPYPAQRRPGR
jgi:hypothetical protein